MLIKKQMCWKVLFYIFCILWIHQVSAAPSAYNWIEVFPETSPSPRSDLSMAFDPLTGQLILFGGIGNGAYFNDTWTWDGNDWIQLSPTTSPPARSGASLAFDAITNQLILFGGYNGAYLNDTWAWNGNNWERLSPANAPPARALASMAFDPFTNQLILFGGVDSNFNFRNDTWAWNGHDWQELIPNGLPNNPIGRSGAALSFDATTNQLILFGGSNPQEFLGDTWIWNGSNWIQLFPATSPPPRTGASMAFDSASGQLILFGGLGLSRLNDTWTWDGTDWIELSTQQSPPIRYGAGLAFDAASLQLVLFGGSGGVPSSALNDTWLWLPLPEVTSISPSSGLISGGTLVTIEGSGFTSVSSVKFGTQEATSFTVVSPSEIMAISPPAPAGTVNITVTTPIGTSLPSSNNQFTYEVLPIPAVTNVSPSSGPTTGGTLVTIEGLNFNSVLAVAFGPNLATVISVDSPTQITVLSPPGAFGTVDVIVATTTGISLPSTAAQFTYLNGPVVGPIITRLSPNSGPIGGGTVVLIEGENFLSALSVEFGNQEASSFTVVSSTEILAVSPPGSAGVVDVTVTTPEGTSPISAADQFTYLTFIGPIVINVSPSAGPTTGGTVVIITGFNFTSDSSVAFGSTPASIFSVDSPNQIIALSPPGSIGTVDVTVTTQAGTSPLSTADQFTYLSPTNVPLVTRVFPPSGPVNGGTIVEITGLNFTGATAVHFGAANALSFTVGSDSQITAISPPGTGTVDVTVTTPNGTSPISESDQFTYTNVLPPIHVRGFQIANRFATQTDYINVLTWKANPQGIQAVTFKIYRDHRLQELAAVISRHEHLRFLDHNRNPEKTYTYFIVAIDQFGNVSTPVRVKIRGEKSR